MSSDQEFVTTSIASSALANEFTQIQEYDLFEPFFMSLSSPGNHWLFISSTGGISAGRKHADLALFPYYTDDKITENAQNTGHFARFQVTQGQKSSLWIPFLSRELTTHNVKRTLYKNNAGNQIIFEELNESLGLGYRYAWTSSRRFGIVLSAKLFALENCSPETKLTVLAGIQNILPAGANSQLQNDLSNLLNAYKRSELYTPNLGIYSLSATLSDRAEPSECLRATTIWSCGSLTNDAQYLISTDQLKAFYAGDSLKAENDVCGKRGAYLINRELTLSKNKEVSWYIVAELTQDHKAVHELTQYLLNNSDEQKIKELEASIEADRIDLVKLVARADGLQQSKQKRRAQRHYLNTMYNIMRGGLPLAGYSISASAFQKFILKRNKPLYNLHKDFLSKLAENIQYQDLLRAVEDVRDPQLTRLSLEYLPLTFCRRHGDPSRPWNHFTIITEDADGKPMAGYQGNWRDIFQNWEALSFTYPSYTLAMIVKFLNATTIDGYNPYRISQDGIDWEKSEPDSPWANIGYWGDHQIIYLQKLLENLKDFAPQEFKKFLTLECLSTANIPYRIKPYAEIIKNWYNTIEYDTPLDTKIEAAVHNVGTDARLLPEANDMQKASSPILMNSHEKMLLLLLVKMGNFIPQAGIWLNTQRPEWNDANNALVGKGCSIVTLAYLRRYISFLLDIYNEQMNVPMIGDLHQFYTELNSIFKKHVDNTLQDFNAASIKAMMDMLGAASSSYRNKVYTHGVSSNRVTVKSSELQEFLKLCLQYVDHSLKLNRRPDGLWHSYNTLQIVPNGINVKNLYEMLEGQVAIISSGLLSATEVTELLTKLEKSELYCSVRKSYMLYPNRRLAGFAEKNSFDSIEIKKLKSYTTVLNKRIITESSDKRLHFSGDFHNVSDLRKALEQVTQAEPELAADIQADAEHYYKVFEQVFDHDRFTGRSGTFFAYEGLGSIYWHMVGKLLLAVQEVLLSKPDTKLYSQYEAIRAGLGGYSKSARDYGAFPCDPYSHTPIGQGAKQPGMTGHVKEEFITRLKELGVTIKNGALSFSKLSFFADELLEEASEFFYVDTSGKEVHIALPVNSLAFTLCQTPIIYQQTKGKTQLHIKQKDGSEVTQSGTSLPAKLSAELFAHSGSIKSITVEWGAE